MNKREDYSFIQYRVEECKKDFNDFTPIWRRPNVEGKILCCQFDLQGMCIIEILKDLDTPQPVFSYHVVHKEGYKNINASEGHTWLLKRNVPKWVVEQDSLHFVPLLESSEKSSDIKCLQEETMPSSSIPASSSVHSFQLFSSLSMIEPQQNKIPSTPHHNH